MADSKYPLMQYLHVPMQVGCDRTFERMKRRYDLEEMDAFLKRETAIIPDLCIGTDLMVGFPRETEEDFAKTCETFVDSPFSYSHLFTYSEREGTPAARSSDQVPMEERRRRSAHLCRLSASKIYGLSYWQ